MAGQEEPAPTARAAPSPSYHHHARAQWIAHVRSAEATIVAVLRSWDERRRSVQPAAAPWQIEALNSAPHPPLLSRGECRGTQAIVVTVVPTAQACQALADFVCESGLFRIDSRSVEIRPGLEKLSFVTRSGISPWPKVAVELTVRSHLQHFWWLTTGSDHAAPVGDDRLSQEMRELDCVLGHAEAAASQVLASKLVEECCERIDRCLEGVGHRAPEGWLGAKETLALAAWRQKILSRLRLAVGDDPGCRRAAMEGLRYELEQLPEYQVPQRQALAAAIGRVEDWRAALPQGV